MKEYIKIARPDHWFKNVFVLPGTAFALFFLPGEEIESLLSVWGMLVLGLLSTCLIASANYTINEFLDAEFDRHHPKKKFRATVQGGIEARGVIIQYAVLTVAGLGLAALINLQFLLIGAFLLVMGVIYNVKPMRSKDRAYVDVLSESINNPIRFMLGWSVVLPLGAPSAFGFIGSGMSLDSQFILPPSSVLLSYWFGGAFLMAMKRFSEYRHINDPEVAGRYRSSFRVYNEEKLMVSSFFYALCSAFFLAIFLIKYRIELLISFPFIALLFTWYLQIALKEDSVTQNPEKLYREWRFLLFVVFLCLLIIGLFVVEIEPLRVLLERIEPGHAVGGF